MHKTALIIFILVFATIAISDSALKCSICGKTIKSSYVRYEDGSVFCMNCSEKYPHCAVCGKPSDSTIKIDGQDICEGCLAKLDRCGFCGLPLTGNYVIYPDLNLKLCERCNKSVPRCDLCEKPDLNLIRVGDNRICKSCFDLSDFCNICGNPIQGEFVWFDGDSTKKYCPNCVNKYPRCACCGAPSGRRSKILDDGRILCRNCYNNGYFDANKVKFIKEKVLSFIEKRFNMGLKHKIKYALQGQDFIKNKSEGVSGDLNGLFYRHGDTYEIYVLYGLREKDLYQVIPHEIAHAWAAENLRENLSLDEAEGFAQWIAYYTLRNFGFKGFSKTLLKGDNEYARGLRMMLEIEARGGIEAVFKHLAK